MTRPPAGGQSEGIVARTRTTGRRCTATTKAGSPCRAAPLTGRTVCLAHADAVTRGSTGFTAEAGRKGGRPRQPRTIEVVRERVEDQADAIIRVYLDAAEAVTPDGRPDHPVRLRAVEALMDRAYGKPKQISELSGPDAGPVELAGRPVRVDLSYLDRDELEELERLAAKLEG